MNWKDLFKPAPPLDKRVFLDGLSEQKAYCEKRSPMYAQVFAALEADLAAGEPAWFRALAKAWKGRSFETPYEAPLLLLAAVHFRALKGEPGLTAVFPTAGGDRARAPEAVRAFLEKADAAFWKTVSGARLQTNEVTRAVGWMLPACIGFCAQGLPFHLVDLGSSAGLTMIGDYLERFWSLRYEDGSAAEEPPHWRDSPLPVLSRAGLDRAPRHLEDRDDRLWLKACIWADDTARHARFDKAADLFVSLARMRTGPRLHACAFAEMPRWVAENIRPHPEEGLLLFNSQAADFLDDAGYERLKAGIAKTLAPWGERAYWVELELPRGNRKAFHELRVHRLIEGRFESRVLATAAAHPSEVRVRPGWDFLAPKTPVRKRFTIEEPERQLLPGTYKFPMPGDKKT